MQSNDPTPLFAACRNNHAAVASALIEAGATVDFQRFDGATPLHQACQEGHFEAASVLLQAGANTEAADSTDPEETPLYLALQESHNDLVLILLRAGASIDGPPGSTANPRSFALTSTTQAALLVRQAAQLWSAQTHHLFPAPARRRAFVLLKLGLCLANEDRFAAGAAQALKDVWSVHVLAHAVTRH